MILRSLRRFPTPYLLLYWLLSLAFSSSAQASFAVEELQVGVVQRFGEQAKDQLTISSPEGDWLTLEFLGGDMQPQTLTTASLPLEISSTPLPQPVLEERLVLSDHATFETAEESARRWQELGIEVEVTQPGRWQVWAHTDVYNVPLLRRFLLRSLQAQGYTTPYLKTEVQNHKPKISFVVDGYRYNRRQLEITASNNRLRVSKGENSQRGYDYSGSLKVQPNAYGNFSVVNQVPLETYLRGVVPHEIGAGAPYNAVKAQTILARTYALRNLRRFQADDYQLCATTHCQVYRGLSGTDINADRAIAATKGQVLTYNDELVDALYSATTGGVTAFFSDVWDGEERPYLKALIDSPYPVWNLGQKSLAQESEFRRFLNLKNGFNESGRSVFRWNRQGSLEQLNKDLSKYLERTKHPLSDFQTIEDISVKERSSSGRILKLEVKTDRGIVELAKNEARSAFTPPLSTLFYVEPVYETVEADTAAEDTGNPIPQVEQPPQLKGFAFIGGGFGHGVGMSQYGSYNLAKLGWSAEKILAFYYPGTTIEPLREGIVFWPQNN